jgi:hypothetical protein
VIAGASPRLSHGVRTRIDKAKLSCFQEKNPPFIRWYSVLRTEAQFFGWLFQVDCAPWA